MKWFVSVLSDSPCQEQLQLTDPCWGGIWVLILSPVLLGNTVRKTAHLSWMTSTPRSLTHNQHVSVYSQMAGSLLAVGDKTVIHMQTHGIACWETHVRLLLAWTLALKPKHWHPGFFWRCLLLLYFIPTHAYIIPAGVNSTQCLYSCL